MARGILILGSNLGNREDMIDRAREMINEKAGKIVKSSSIFKTEPWGFEADNKFLNQAIMIETELDPQHLLITLMEIEDSLGRKRKTVQFESRLIDIDILFYDDKIIDEKDLQIPHPRIRERMFVLKPLMEIAGEMIHPEIKKTISELYNDCKDKLEVEVYQQASEGSSNNI